MIVISIQARRTKELIVWGRLLKVEISDALTESEQSRLAHLQAIAPTIGLTPAEEREREALRGR